MNKIYFFLMNFLLLISFSYSNISAATNDGTMQINDTINVNQNEDKADNSELFNKKNKNMNSSIFDQDTKNRQNEIKKERDNYINHAQKDPFNSNIDSRKKDNSIDAKKQNTLFKGNRTQRNSNKSFYGIRKKNNFGKYLFITIFIVAFAFLGFYISKNRNKLKIKRSN